MISVKGKTKVLTKSYKGSTWPSPIRTWLSTSPGSGWLTCSREGRCALPQGLCLIRWLFPPHHALCRIALRFLLQCLSGMKPPLTFPVASTLPYFSLLYFFSQTLWPPDMYFNPCLNECLSAHPPSKLQDGRSPSGCSPLLCLLFVHSLVHKQALRTC